MTAEQIADMITAAARRTAGRLGAEHAAAMLRDLATGLAEDDRGREIATRLDQQADAMEDEDDGD